jgi:hypothetical protein
MADEPERDDELREVDPSSDLDLVRLWISGTHDAEMEAMAVQSLLHANGVPAVLMGPSTIPSLEFEVQVPRSRVDEALRILEDARATGPEAALEAQQNGESEGPVQAE